MVYKHTHSTHARFSACAFFSLRSCIIINSQYYIKKENFIIAVDWGSWLGLTVVLLAWLSLVLFFVLLLRLPLFQPLKLNDFSMEINYVGDILDVHFFLCISVLTQVE